MIFESFLERIFERRPLAEKDPAAQLAFAERLFRDPSCIARFAAKQQEDGFMLLAGLEQPDLFAAQLWNHALPAGERISCASAMQVLYRDLFARDPLGEAAHMWFDLLEQSRHACPACEPVRRTVVGVLEAILSMPQEHCQAAALHGLNHWATDAERARIIDAWAAPSGLRAYAAECRAGKAE